MADGEQLKQVFVNLLDNAAEAMSGGGEISISSIAEPDGAGRAAVMVRVQDTGHGIPEDIRSRLFEPFFTTKEEGTGLGLCIAANILAGQGGQIALESSTAGGATFGIRLPVAAEKGDEQDSRR
jgi:signal transduction histidine kinase